MNIEDINVVKEANIVFMGTPAFAVPILDALALNYKVKAVVTQPDKPFGRDGKLMPPPVKRWAEEHTVLAVQPKNLKEEWQLVTDLHPDLIVTCAYGQILPRELLVCPKYGCINVHASLLPKLRGGAPIHRAIIEGFKETGVTIMHMAPSLDSGDIISQRSIVITDDDTASTLHDKLSILGRDLLLETLPSILDGTASRTPQDESLSTFAPNISKEDEKIDFGKTTRQIRNLVRGLNSFPGAYTILDGKRMKVYDCYVTENNFSNLLDGKITNIYPDGIGVKCQNGEVVLTKIQPEGKAKMDAKDYLNGIQDKASLVGKMFE